MPEPVSRNELIRRFRKLGFEGPIAGAKHMFMKKGEHKVRIPNPHHGDISITLLHEIIRQAEIGKSDWEASGE